MKKQTYENQEQIAAPSKRQAPTLEQIRQLAHDSYVARGGAEGLALNDWLRAEQELKQKLEGEQSAAQAAE